MTTRTLPIALVWVALVGMLTGLLLVSQAQSRRELTDGFALRATIGARFAATYVQDLAGRRVYSGAQEVAFTPLGAYLRNAIPIAHNRVYVVDPDGTIIVESGPGPAVTTLDAEDPQLARALRSHEEGSHSSSTGDRRFVSRPIAGTPWRLVSTVPEAELYGSISGPSRWAPWVVVVAFALLALIAAFLLARVLSSRVRLTLLNAELELTARVDVLTGLPNRRHIEEALTGHISATRRHGTPLSILLIDIDHFKAVNDTHGHLAGDQVLRTVAHSLRNSLRLEDLLGRWGGEEFLAVLPATARAGGPHRRRASTRGAGHEHRSPSPRARWSR